MLKFINRFYPFGRELAGSGLKITIADGRSYKVPKKGIENFILYYLGVPHLGARIRAFCLGLLLRGEKTKTNALVLDAGAGVGFNSFLLRRSGYRVFSLDADSRKVKLAKSLARHNKIKDLEVGLGDIRKLPYQDKQLDLIICFEVLEHIEDDKLALLELVRVLRKGGTLIVSFPSDSWLSKKAQKDFGHQRPGYSFKEFRRLAQRYSLDIEKTISFGKTPVGRLVIFLDYKLKQLSLKLSSLFFPLSFPLLLGELFLPEIGKPANYVIKIKKKG